MEKVTGPSRQCDNASPEPGSKGLVYRSVTTGFVEMYILWYAKGLDSIIG
jgi:hypothetical protein